MTNGANPKPDDLATIIAMLKSEVESKPDAVAVEAEDDTVTFAELWERANSCASGLRGAGVENSDVIGVFMESGSSLIVAVWGILLAGAAYLPLANDYPAERVKYMITSSGIRHVITDHASRKALSKLSSHRVAIHIQDRETQNPADHTEPGTPEGCSPAYVIFTSGSTGRPKGVVIPHQAIANQMRWLKEDLGLAHARILLKTPSSFDAAQWELLANAAGGVVIVGRAGIHREPAEMCEIVRRRHVTHLQCVPTLWRALLREPNLPQCSSLQHIFSGGEALTLTTARELLDALPAAEFTNLYGPTEATINATWLRVTPAVVSSDHAHISIGSPVPGCTVHILDGNQRPVRSGEIGELYIGGIQVATGYLHQPEQTTEKFVTINADGVSTCVYRTGDLARIDASGSLDFHGRMDDQVKVNGHRVETEEVRLMIEEHHWVRAAAVVPWVDPRDQIARLAAFVELDPDQAAVMDADHAGQHHRSKAGHEQVRAQLAGRARRLAPTGTTRVALPGETGTSEQHRVAFARKTYRFYEGGEIDAASIRALITEAATPPPVVERRNALTLSELAHLLRWFGPFASTERLLPKYAYASPGALNATQLYVETSGVDGLPNGLYYYDPTNHEIVRVASSAGGLPGPVRLHFNGIPSVIETVYATNVAEVLHFESGHMLGLLEYAAAEQGYHLHPTKAPAPLTDEQMGRSLRTAVVDLLTAPPEPDAVQQVRLTVQFHPLVPDGRPGTYELDVNGLRLLTDSVIERRHVIAINQETYDRSSFGVALSLPSTAGWEGMVELGRVLQRLQMNDHNVGFMSAGYSSLTGRHLPSAVQYHDITGDDCLLYFAVGGRVSAEQIASTGMKEDSVHTRGPEEILRDDLRRVLPYYMVPAQVKLVESIPVSINGKHDRAALIAGMEAAAPPVHPADPPRSAIERKLLTLWQDTLGPEATSVTADFFDLGGNSLDAVQLVNRINRSLQTNLPVQTIFEASTVRALGRAVEASSPTMSRVIRLADGPADSSIFVWPGLGGYPMNLRTFAGHDGGRHTVYAVQTHGLNEGERPYGTLKAMVDEDVRLIMSQLPPGRLTLAGYSFGARVASEVALALDRVGVDFDQLILIAPGSPHIPNLPVAPTSGHGYTDPYFRQMAYSVFLGRLADEEHTRLLNGAADEESFLRLLSGLLPTFDQTIARRILQVAEVTFGFRSERVDDMTGLLDRVQVFTAAGDGPSFLDEYRGQLIAAGSAHKMDADHYSIVRAPAVATVADHIRLRQLAEK